MKNIKDLIKKCAYLAIVTVFAASVMVVDLVHADVFDRLREDTVIASPGYLNAAKLRTDYVLRQTTPKGKTMTEKAVDYVRGSFAKKLVIAAQDEGQLPVNLQTKTSPEETASSATTGTISSLPDDFNDSSFIDPVAAEKMFDEAMESGARVTELSGGNMVSIWREDSTHWYFKVINVATQEVLVNKQRFATADGVDNYYVYDVTDVGNGQFAAVVRSYDSDYRRNYYSKSESIYSVRVYDYSQGGSGNLVNQQDYKSNYYYNYQTRRYTSSGSYVSSLTSLGDGNFAMSVRTYDYGRNSSGYYSNSNSYIAVTDSSLDINSGNTSVYQLDNYRTGNWSDGNYKYKYQYANDIVSLGDGTFALAISEYSYSQASRSSIGGTYLNVMDNNMSTLSQKFYSNTSSYEAGKYYDYSSRYVSRMVKTGEGTFAVAWNSYSGSYDYTSKQGSWDSSINISTYDSAIEEQSSYYIAQEETWKNDGNTWSWSRSYITDMKALDDGSIVVAVNSWNNSYNYDTRKSSWSANASIKVIDSGGLSFELDLGSINRRTKNWSVTQIASLGGGTFGVILNEQSSVGGSKTTMEQFTSKGVSLTDTSRDSTASTTNTASMPQRKASDATSDGTKEESSDGTTDTSTKSTADASESNKGLKKSLDGSLDTSLKANAGVLSDEDLLALLGDSLLEKDALSIFSVFAAGGANDLLAMLANILKNPTEMQRTIIDTVSALLSELSEMEQKANESLEQAKDDFVEMAAAALLAQELPGLLTTEDLSALKTLFTQFDKAKGGLMAKYQSSMKAYYDEVKKTLADNISNLQLNNLVSKDLSEQELKDMPPSEIEKLMEKLRRAERKTTQVRNILQRESQYREEHLDPREKELEKLFKKFTQKLSTVLEGAAKEQGKDKE